MKLLNKALVSVLLGSVMTMSAQAAISYTNGQAYVGAKVGKFMVDADDMDDPTAFGVYAGYNFNPNFGAEIEYVGSNDADIDVGSGINAEYNLKTYGAYGTYRYQFPNTGIYAKGKLGFAKTEVEVDVNDVYGNSGAGTGSDSGVAGGIGLGYSFNPNMSVETEYDYVAEDTTLLTIGANLKF